MRRYRQAVAACLGFLLAIAATAAGAGGEQLPRVGWVYRSEGHIEGQPVQYVGSAADLKQRLAGNHRWVTLLEQGGTKVYAMEVFAELDVPSSGRRTLLSARTEALRAAEQRAMEQMEERVEAANRSRGPGQKETKILNERRAAIDAGAWEVRHRVTTSGRWQLLERGVSSVTTKAFVALTLLDAYLLYRNDKLSRYITAPYVLGDEKGFFTLERSDSLLSPKYYKTYVGEGAGGQRVELSSSDFRELKEEAEALWGTTDWRGDFVPGLLNRRLPILRPHDMPRVQ